MNILIVTFHSPYTNDPTGGAETSLKLIAEEFVKKGHKVVFFSNTQQKTSLGFIKKTVNGVEVVVFSKFKIDLINTYKFKKIVSFFRKIYIKKVIKKTQIVHTYNNLGIIKFYANLKNEFNFKLVVRIAGLKSFEDLKRRPKLATKYENYFRSIDLYNFISEGLRTLVLQKKEEYNLDLDFNPCFVKDIGIDASKLPSKKNQNISQEPFKIIMASRLSKYQKRQDLLIKAMQLLKNEPILLTILGNGNNKINLLELRKSLDLDTKIIFKPFDNNVWNDLVNYDLLVHACDYEGLSKIIIESMSVGLPVLASNVSPLNNYIVDNENGFLVDNDPNEWAEKIHFIYNNQDGLPIISKNSKKYIRQNYSSSYNVNDYELKFEELINSTKK